MIHRFLCNVDIYGAKVELNFNKKRIHNTAFGGFLTIVVVITFGIGFWFSAKNLVTRDSPTVINSMRSVIEPERVYVNKQNITLMVSVVDTSGELLNDPRVIKLQTNQEITKNIFDETQNSTISDLTINSVQMEQCSLDSVGNKDLLPYFQKIKFDKMYCFSSADPNIFLEGDSDSDSFSQIFIDIQKCQNSTDANAPVCLPINDINERLKNSKVSIFMSDQFFDPYSFETPFKFRGINLYTLVSSTLQKEFQIFFMNQYVQDDVGILVNDIFERRGFFYSETQDTVFYSEEDILARILLRMAKHREQFITRRYLKITDVVGQVGGLLKILMTAGSILCIPFVRLHLHQAIVNEIFNFKFINESRHKKIYGLFSKNNNNNIDYKLKPKVKSLLSPSKNKKQPKTLFQHTGTDEQANNQDQDKKFVRSRTRSKQNCGQQTPEEQMDEVQSAKLKKAGDALQHELQSCCLDSNYTIKKRKTIIEAAKTIFVVTKSIIQYGFIDYIVHFLFPRSKGILRKKQLVDQSINKIFDHLDVLYLLNKMLEIEKLKKILLNEDQLRLFEFIPKPEIEEDRLKELLGVEESQFSIQVETNTIKNRGRMEIIENGKVQNSDIQAQKCIDNKNLYDLYSKQKAPGEIALEAYQGLVNILKKEKKSERDKKLIELIDPSILQQYQKQITEFEKKNNLISMQQSNPNNVTNNKNNLLDLSEEDMNISFQNQIQKITNQKNPFRSSIFQSNKNIFNQLKSFIPNSCQKDQSESEILSTHLSIPQEIRDNSSRRIDRKKSLNKENGMFKSLKELNNLRKISLQNSPKLKKANSSIENSFQLSTSLSQIYNPSRKKQLHN